MSNIQKVKIILQLTQNEEKKAFQKYLANKKILDAEIKKYDLLNGCLLESREKLAKQTNVPIAAMNYRQYKQFIMQLEIAIKQQTETIETLQKTNLKLLNNYKQLNHKIKKLEEAIVIEHNASLQALDKKEQQNITDSFNAMRNPRF